MDTSETYIKMVTKAEEIQALKPRPPLPWNGWLGSEAVEAWEHEWIANPTVKIASPIYPSAIWLPRQDELQEMMGDDWAKTFNDFAWWVQSDDNSGVDEFNFENRAHRGSMEQLWLAFVMTKYNKVWNGTDWEVANA